MLISLLPLICTALGLGASLFLFVSLKRELHRVQHQLREAGRTPTSPLRPGLNIHKRVQALRLLRRGEDVGHIAAALSVPRREVELLIHVQEFSAKRSGTGFSL